MRHLVLSGSAALVALAVSLPVAAQTAQTPSGAPAAAKARLPYAAVHDPEFVGAAQATWVGDEDRVIGVMTGSTAKAFPAGILTQHGLVEDKSPSGPIAVTW